MQVSPISTYHWNLGELVQTHLKPRIPLMFYLAYLVTDYRCQECSAEKDYQDQPEHIP